ncbi:hypothetical protein BaRGS_00009183 [Batillaria attramentaria]|uniref:Uncharacterized protein n=1 Tax=Batillaria attramentaria TaxID=370345 RepID=A0ABD0LK01_9CAEN
MVMYVYGGQKPAEPTIRTPGLVSPAVRYALSSVSCGDPTARSLAPTSKVPTMSWSVSITGDLWPSPGAAWCMGRRLTDTLSQCVGRETCW